MASPRSSPFRGGMPKNYDSGGSSSDTDSGMCLTLVEKKLRSTAMKTKSKVFGRCGLCGYLITGEGQRVELAIPNTVNSKKFVLDYDSNGVAKLHSQCWKSVQSQLRKRVGRRYIKTAAKYSTGVPNSNHSNSNHSNSNHSNSNHSNSNDSKNSEKCVPEQQKIESVERCILKEVSGAAEYYDNMVTVGWEAIRIARLIKSSKHCIVFTGAGISTAAGIGDYRGKSGKWTNHDLQDFISDMSLTKQEPHDQESEAGVDYETLRPTYTHEALAVLKDKGYIKYIISQNGDGLHKLSGIKNDQISELHGNVFEEYCEDCGDRYAREMYTLDDTSGQYYDEIEDFGKSDIILPNHAQKCRHCGLSHRTGRTCLHCGGHLIDTIINFGDDLEEDILTRAEEHAARADLVISCGTTMAVTPANSLVTRNKASGLVICNRQKTDFDALCTRTNKLGHKTGSRVYTDCDVLMKCVMSLLLNTNDLIRWEGERELRMREYDKQRQEPLPPQVSASCSGGRQKKRSSKKRTSNRGTNSSLATLVVLPSNTLPSNSSGNASLLSTTATRKRTRDSQTDVQLSKRTRSAKNKK